MDFKEYVKKTNASEQQFGIFDSYEVESLIGAGGFSKVYRVKKNGKQFAMKIPISFDLESESTIAYTPDEQFIENFKKEANNWVEISTMAPDSVVQF